MTEESAPSEAIEAPLEKPIKDPIPIVSWVALLYLKDVRDIDRAAEAYFGPQKTAQSFVTNFGIDLRSFLNHYIEVDKVPAPIGPVIRGPIRPVLIIRQTDSGFQPYLLSGRGFYNQKAQMAWILEDDWNALVGELA